MKISQLRLGISALILTTFFPFVAMAQNDQSDAVFEEGYALIYCKADPDNVISTEIFNAAFPEWITTLSQHAKNGIVVRAHFLGVLKEGIFVVVDGEDRMNAMDNARSILDELLQTLDSALSESQKEQYSAVDEGCQILEIGPLAVE